MSQTHAISAQNCAPACSTSPRSRFDLFSLLALWRSRQQLAQLDDEQLADIGVTLRDATKEASRAPWDVPAHWRN